MSLPFCLAALLALLLVCAPAQASSLDPAALPVLSLVAVVTGGSSSIGESISMDPPSISAVAQTVDSNTLSAANGTALAWSSVPEPASVMLMLAGLGLIGLRTRRADRCVPALKRAKTALRRRQAAMLLAGRRLRPRCVSRRVRLGTNPLA